MDQFGVVYYYNDVVKKTLTAMLFGQADCVSKIGIGGRYAENLMI